MQRRETELTESNEFTSASFYSIQKNFSQPAFVFETNQVFIAQKNLDLSTYKIYLVLPDKYSRFSETFIKT